MKIPRYAFATLMLGLLLPASQARAAAWSLGKLFTPSTDAMPFGTTPDGTPLVSIATRPKPKTTLPGMVNSITTAPKRFYNGTKAMLTPTKKPTSTSRQTTIKRNVNQKSTDKQPSLLKSMFTPAEPYQPRTVTEWMAQKRLDP